MKQSLFFMIAALLALTACDERLLRARYLVKDPSVLDHVAIEKDAVVMYASPADRLAGKIECRIHESEYRDFVRLARILDTEALTRAYLAKGTGPFPEEARAALTAPRQPSFGPERTRALPLKGLRVALDPGHSASNLDEAIREGKYAWLFAEDGTRLRFFEAGLNLATARILRELLELDGAEVMLTRTTGGIVFPKPYHQWRVEDFYRGVMDKVRERHITPQKGHYLLNGAAEDERFRFFIKEFETPHRARLINAFRPHCTVIIHFDMAFDEMDFRKRNRALARTNGRGRRVQSAAELQDRTWSMGENRKNYCEAFVPGAFMKDELLSVESRIEFLRLLLSTDLEDSARFSSMVTSSFERILKVPCAGDDYAPDLNIPMARGVFARNLRMTRLVRGPLCLGEALQQNHLPEAKRLAVISQGRVPDRIRQVAKAYHAAVRRYAKELAGRRVD